MGMNNLTDFLAVRGLSSTLEENRACGKGVCSSGNEITDYSSEEQLRKLTLEYEKRLQKYHICDPKSIPANDRVDNIIQWPRVNVGVIFSYILRVRDFNADYIGRYKDQKAYSYFDGGFVDSIFAHEPSGKNVVFIYSTVKLWILAAKEPVQILTSSCDCMAGVSQSLQPCHLQHCTR